MQWEQARKYARKEKLQLEAITLFFDNRTVPVTVGLGKLGERSVVYEQTIGQQKELNGPYRKNQSDASLLECAIDQHLYRHVISELKYNDGTLIYPDKTEMCAWVWVVKKPDGSIVSTEREDD